MSLMIEPGDGTNEIAHNKHHHHFIPARPYGRLHGLNDGSSTRHPVSRACAFGQT
jgi:hypothetical protein